jgi:hypothetical protein
MALIDVYNLRYDSEFLARLKGAVAMSAYDIVTNPSGKSALRLQWAQKSIKEPELMAERMAWAVAGNPTIATSGAQSTDNDILYVVNLLQETFAEV